MFKFPMTFEVEAEASAGINTNWTAQSDALPPIPSAIAQGLMGPGKGYSSEDLIGIALLNCLITTFKIFCETSKVSFEEICGKAMITVNKQAAVAAFRITSIEVFLDVKGASDVEKAKNLLDKSLLNSAVCNAVTACKSFHLNVN